MCNWNQPMFTTRRWWHNLPDEKGNFERGKGSKVIQDIFQPIHCMQQLISNARTRYTRGRCTMKISTASESVWLLREASPLPVRICQVKTGLLDSANSLAPPCCCRHSSNRLTMLSDRGSDPFATIWPNISSISSQSLWQNHSPSGSSCQLRIIVNT